MEGWLDRNVSEGSSLGPIRYLACRCYIWPIVLPAFQIRSCVRCGEFPDGSSFACVSAEAALAAFVSEHGHEPEPFK